MGVVQVLTAQLLAGPPSIRHLKQLIQQDDSLKDFLDLVRQFLPEHEAEIMADGPDIRAFARYFEEEYFPLYVEEIVEGMGEEDELERFVAAIPIYYEGLDSEDYENDLRSWRGGFRLAFALVANPFADPNDETGGRVALLESVSELIGQSLLGRIPAKGFSREELQVLAGTEYEGLIAVADWMWAETGSVFLDTRSEDGWEMPIEWSRENVDRLTEEWAIREAYTAREAKIRDLLEENPRKHMRKILDILQDTPHVPKEQLRFPGEEFSDPDE